jgi:hypothetical protein
MKTTRSGGADPLVRGRRPRRPLWTGVKSRPGGRLRTRGSAPPDCGSKTRIVSSALAVVLIASPILAQQDRTEAHVILMISEPGPRRIMKDAEFSKQAHPGPDTTLKLLVESSRPCRAVVAAFNKEGLMAYGGLPVSVPVEEYRNNEIPTLQAPKWTWDGHEKLSEINVILLAEHSPDSSELSRLVDAMRDSGLGEAVRKRQIGSLRRWIDAHSQSGTTASDYTLKSTPILIGGTTRSLGCDWCKSAKAVSIPGGGSAVIRIRLE